jgi:hypothetical protein
MRGRILLSWAVAAAIWSVAGCGGTVRTELMAGGTGGSSGSAAGGGGVGAGSGASTTAMAGGSAGDGGSANGGGGANGGGAGNGGGGAGGGAACADGPCWLKRFGLDTGVVSQTVGIDGTGRVLAAGAFKGSLDFGAGPLPQAGPVDAFVVALDPAGQHVWSRSFGSPMEGTEIESLSIQTDDSIIVTGNAVVPVDFGGGPRCIPFLDHQAFVVKLDPQGKHVYSLCFGPPSASVFFPKLVADSAGNTFLVAAFNGTMDLGGGQVKDSSKGPLLIVKLDPKGQMLWAKTFGGPSGSVDPRAAVAAGNDLLLAGDLYGSIDFGGGVLSSQGQGPGVSNVAIARLDPNGNHLWSHAFPSKDDQKVVSAAADPAGRLVITGGMSGTVDFGGGPLTSAGYADIYVASFDPGGKALWSKRFGGQNADVGRAIACDADGDVFLLAEPATSVDFGGGALAADLLGFARVRFDATGAFLDDWFVESAQARQVVARGKRYVLTGGAGGPLDLGGGLSSPGGGTNFVASYSP